MKYTAQLHGKDTATAHAGPVTARRWVFPRHRKKHTMKSGIHPNYHDATITCGSCGHVYQTKSTGSDKLTTEICGNCHPFYTGKQKMLDSAGRVDKFLSKYGMKK